MGVEPKNRGKTPKSSILIGFSIIFTHPFWGFSPHFWKHRYRSLEIHSYSQMIRVFNHLQKSIVFRFHEAIFRR